MVIAERFVATVARWVSWKLRLSHAVQRALMPFADELLPDVKVFVARELLGHSASSRALVREVEQEASEQIRTFINLRCAHKHQSPKLRVTLLDTLRGVVDVRVEESSQERSGAVTPRRLSLVSPVLANGALTIEEGESVVIGGAHATAPTLPTTDDAMSRRHFEITVRDRDYRVRDLDSLNGTYLNGERLDASAHPLAAGDRLQAGDSVFDVEASA
jgi:hypothetical protein